MSMILHDWKLDRKLHLIQAAYDALPAGGVLITVDPLIDDARRTDAFGLLMSLNMLIEFGDAFGYTRREFASGANMLASSTSTYSLLPELPPQQSLTSSPPLMRPAPGCCLPAGAR